MFRALLCTDRTRDDVKGGICASVCRDSRERTESAQLSWSHAQWHLAQEFDEQYHTKALGSQRDDIRPEHRVEILRALKRDLLASQVATTAFPNV
jgi:hypothetical protein